VGVAPPASASASSRCSVPCFIVLVLRFSSVFATNAAVWQGSSTSCQLHPPYAASLCKAVLSEITSWHFETIIRYERYGFHDVWTVPTLAKTDPI
jgi:hypothetical protein